MSNLDQMELTPIPNPPLQRLRSMSIEGFRRQFSSQTTPPKHFADPIGHFTTNEYDYPSSLGEIKVREGLHLAVLGGLDPVLGQVAIAHPDLTLLIDINNDAINTSIEGRVLPLKDSQSGEEYWGKVNQYFKKVIRKTDPKRWDFPNDQDIRLGGWSNKDHFAKVQTAFREGKIKFVSGDLIKDGLELMRKISKETGIPLRLIYVSNIFDYLANNQEAFKQMLRMGVEEGWIDKEAQIIDTGTSKEGLETKVFSIQEYTTVKP